MKKLIAISFGIVTGLAACNELDIKQPGLLVPKTVDQDASLPSISVANTKLHAETFGQSTDPMVIVLHGGPGVDYRSLLNCQQLASNGYYVVFYDQRGSGLSRREDKSVYTIQLLLDDLTAVINHYRTSPNQQVTLLGHSWGAILATAYINKYPTAIHSAILCEPGGFVWKDIKEYVSRSQDYSITSEGLSDVTYVDQFITAKENEHASLDYKFALEANNNSADDLLGNEGHVPFWRLGAVINKRLFDLGNEQQPDWSSNLSAYKTKVLFIYSERNKAYGRTYAEHVSSAYPSVQLVRIDDAGHDMLTFPSGWNNFYPVALNYLNELK